MMNDHRTAVFGGSVESGRKSRESKRESSTGGFRRVLRGRHMLGEVSEL